MKNATTVRMVEDLTKALRRAAFLGLAMALGSQAQLAKGATKFLGNITTSNTPRANFIASWNQITPENETKWGAVESKRGVYNWAGADRVRDTAQKYGIPWKFHTLVWGSQQPGWITGLSQADQLDAITKWFDAAAARYPNVQMIDVVNEAAPGHAPAPYKNALGGDGATGYDWIVTAFKMARARWPKAILIYNDYNILEYRSDINWIKTTIPKLIAAGAPIDAVGFQCHAMKGMRADTLKNRLDDIGAAIKVPMYISEYDIADTSAAGQVQLDNYKAQFPVIWNHPQVAGVTLWGYVYGTTWVKGTGIVSATNVDRPAMTWLRSYVSANKNPPSPNNQQPSITMSRTSANLKVPGALTFSWTAKDPDGTVKLVELLQGPVGVNYLPQAAALQSATGTFSVSGLEAGTYSFTPKVTDNRGKVVYGASQSVTIGANQLPVITMSCPTTTLKAPATLTCSWKASDSDGTVKLAEVLQGGVGVNYLPQSVPAASASGTFSVPNLAWGSYSFTPKVTDNEGGIRYGTSVKVTVRWNYALSTSGASNWFGGLRISYALPPTTTSASAEILTSTGTLVKSIVLQPGTTSSRFTSLSGRPAGNYTVRLIVNGVVQDSKGVLKL